MTKHRYQNKNNHIVEDSHCRGGIIHQSELYDYRNSQYNNVAIHTCDHINNDRLCSCVVVVVVVFCKYHKLLRKPITDNAVSKY